MFLLEVENLQLFPMDTRAGLALDGGAVDECYTSSDVDTITTTNQRFHTQYINDIDVCLQVFHGLLILEKYRCTQLCKNVSVPAFISICC